MDRVKTSLPVSESFGPVWQGEGAYTGVLAHFLRLGGCNLTCSWCDSAYTWNGTETFEQFSPAQLADVLDDLAPDHVLVLTGGEPLIHQHNDVLMDAVVARPWLRVHVETNGTIQPSPFWMARVEHWTVSPKLITSDPQSKRLKDRALRWFGSLARDDVASFKIVCSSPDDVDAAARFLDEWAVPKRHGWIMPEGVDAATILGRARTLAPAVLRNGLNLTLRQQVLLYGTERNR